MNVLSGKMKLKKAECMQGYLKCSLRIKNAPTVDAVPMSVIEDIKTWIEHWESEPETINTDPYQIGAIDMKKYVLRVIDKHCGKENG